MPPHRSPEIVLLSRTLAVARLQVELARLHNARMFAWDDLRHNIDLATPYGLRMHRGMQQTPRASADFVASEIKSFRALVWGQNRHSGWMFASLTERGPLTVPLSRQSANFARPFHGSAQGAALKLPLLSGQKGVVFPSWEQSRDQQASVAMSDTRTALSAPARHVAEQCPHGSHELSARLPQYRNRSAFRIRGRRIVAVWSRFRLS